MVVWVCDGGVVDVVFVDVVVVVEEVCMWDVDVCEV